MEITETKKLEETKAQITAKVKRHLANFHKHNKAHEKVGMETLWFRADRFPDKYKPVFQERYHAEEMAYELEELVFDLIYNHELIDFKKLEKSNPLKINKGK